MFKTPLKGYTLTELQEQADNTVICTFVKEFMGMESIITSVLTIGDLKPSLRCIVNSESFITTKNGTIYHSIVMTSTNQSFVIIDGVLHFD